MRNYIKSILLWAVALSLLSGFSGFAIADHNDSLCAVSNAGMESMERGEIMLINDAGEALEFKVLVADDNAERAYGFQYICSEVVDRTLILFQYPGLVGGKFHMRNVHSSLDIAFFDDQGKLIYQTLMLPYVGASKPVYGPTVRFQFALEAYEGFYAEHGISTDNSFLKLQ